MIKLDTRGQLEVARHLFPARKAVFEAVYEQGAKPL